MRISAQESNDGTVPVLEKEKNYNLLQAYSPLMHRFHYIIDYLYSITVQICRPRDRIVGRSKVRDTDRVATEQHFQNFVFREILTKLFRIS